MQGGLLGRPVEFLIYDDESDEKTAVRLYEKLIVEDKVDAILGPYGTAITEAIADIPDKHRQVMVAANAATSSIWGKGPVPDHGARAGGFREGLPVAAGGGLPPPCRHEKKGSS